MGEGADIAGMRKLAEMGNGRMYYAGPFDSLPKIFTKETMMISGSYVQNRSFTPAVTDSQIQALDEAVRELGVGLTVFGGDSSYALGGCSTERAGLSAGRAMYREDGAEAS